MYIEIRNNTVLHVENLKAVAKAPNTKNIIFLYFPYDYDIIKLIIRLINSNINFMYTCHNKIGFYDAHIIKDINEYIEEHEGVVAIIHDHTYTKGSFIEYV